MLPAKSFSETSRWAILSGHYKAKRLVCKEKRKNYARRGIERGVSLLRREDEILANGDAG
jgi:hypothetical protein